MIAVEIPNLQELLFSYSFQGLVKKWIQLFYGKKTKFPENFTF